MLLSPHTLFNYTLMNVFIGTFMTIEYAAKALVSWPIRALFSGVEASTLLVLIHDPHNEINQFDSLLMVKENYEGNLKLVSIPRYMQFLAAVKKLSSSSITFINIAGNDHILCKIRYKKDAPPALNASWIQKFTWNMPTIPEYLYAAYLVPVRELKEFIKTVEGNHNSQLLYLHDF